MNKLTTLTFCFVILIIGLLNAQKKISDECLAIVGLFDNPQIITNVKAYLYEGGNKVDSALVDSDKDFGFVLKRNRRYSVQIIRQGYYPRLIAISTDLPKDVNAVPMFIFEFEITLLHEIKWVDDFYTDFPIALIAYDSKIEKFVYSKKYTNLIQTELKKVESQFKVRKSN